MDSSAGVSQVDEYFIVLVPPKPWPKNIRLKIVESDRYHQMMSSFKTPEQAVSDSKVAKLSSSYPNSTKLSSCTCTSTATTSPGASLKPDNRDVGTQVNMLQTGVVRPVLRHAHGAESRLYSNQRQSMGTPLKAHDSGNDSATAAKLKYFRTVLTKLQNLVTTGTYGRPSRWHKLLDGYVDHVCRVYEMITTEDISRIEAFVRETEHQRFSHELYWKWSRGKAANENRKKHTVKTGMRRPSNRSGMHKAGSRTPFTNSNHHFNLAPDTVIGRNFLGRNFQYHNTFIPSSEEHSQNCFPTPNSPFPQYPPQDSDHRIPSPYAIGWEQRQLDKGHESYDPGAWEPFSEQPPRHLVQTMMKDPRLRRQRKRPHDGIIPLMQARPVPTQTYMNQ